MQLVEPDAVDAECGDRAQAGLTQMGRTPVDLPSAAWSRVTGLRRHEDGTADTSESLQRFCDKLLVVVQVVRAQRVGVGSVGEVDARLDRGANSRQRAGAVRSAFDREVHRAQTDWVKCSRT